MKKINATMALQWFIYLPVILPICIILGAAQGIFQMMEKLADTVRRDLYF